jgi:chromosome segregation ATPase
MNKPETLQGKIEKLETLVDALLEERRGLREDMRKIEIRLKKMGDDPHHIAGDDFVRSLDDLRGKFAESESINQKLQRERGQVRERLLQILNRLDLIEAKLLEQRTMTPS